METSLDQSCKNKNIVPIWRDKITRVKYKMLSCDVHNWLRSDGDSEDYYSMTLWGGYKNGLFREKQYTTANDFFSRFEFVTWLIKVYPD